MTPRGILKCLHSKPSDRISNEGTPLILMHYSELRDMALESGSRFSRRHSQYVRL